MNLPSVFDSKGRMIDLTDKAVRDLPEDDIARFEALREAYIANKEAEAIAADLAQQIVVVVAAVREERLQRQRRAPIDRVQQAKHWIADQRENARRERGL